MPQLGIKEFADKVKGKYPEYAGLDDSDLVQRVLSKYPEYRDVVTDSEGITLAALREERIEMGVMERLMALPWRMQMEPALAMSTAVAPVQPKGMVQRILDDRDEREREEMEMQTAAAAGPRGKDATSAEEEIEDDPPTRLQKAVDSFQTGSAGLVDLVGGGMIWAGFEDSGTEVRDYAQRVIKNNEVKELYKEFEWSDLADPDFYLTKGVQMVPSLLTLIPAAVGGGILGAAGATALGAGVLVTSISAAVASAVVARPLESAMEAAGTYNSLLDQGASREQAAEGAAGVFTKNMALIGMDVGQFALAFAKVPAPLRKGMADWIKRVGVKAVGFAAGAASEGYEEVLQGYFQELGEQSLNGEVDASILESLKLAGPEAKEAFVLGTIGGGLFQAVGTAKQLLTPQETDAIIQEQIDNAPGGAAEEAEVVAKGDQAGEVAPVKPKAPEEVAPTAVEKPAERPVATVKPETRPEVPIEGVKAPKEGEKPIQQPPVAAEKGAAGEKQPWEMTRQEFIDIESEYWKKTEKPARVYQATLGASHYKSVEKAFSEGKPVPAAVLAEYPELGEGAPKEGAVVPEKGTEGIIKVAEGIEPRQISLSKIKVNKELFQPREKVDPDMVRQIAEGFDQDCVAFWTSADDACLLDVQEALRLRSVPYTALLRIR